MTEKNIEFLLIMFLFCVCRHYESSTTIQLPTAPLNLSITSLSKILSWVDFSGVGKRNASEKSHPTETEDAEPVLNKTKLGFTKGYLWRLMRERSDSSRFFHVQFEAHGDT